MTKEQFRDMMEYHANTTSHGRRMVARERYIASEWRAFDPKLAKLAETACDKWDEVYAYIQTRMGGEKGA